MSPGPQSIQRTVDCASLRFEKNRLATFDNWPSDAPHDKQCWARCGFFYRHVTLCVECFSCGLSVSQWWSGAGEVGLVLRHRQLSPDCAFLQQCADNVPLVRVDTECAIALQDSGYTSSSSSTHSPLGSQESAPPASGFRYSVLASAPSDDALPPRSSSFAGGQQLARERVRRRSFSEGSSWRCAVVSGQELAAAGFVAVGDGDKAQCVFCRGVVGNWQQGDEPLAEHRRLFPLCPFVRGCAVGNVPIESDTESDTDTDDDERQDPADEEPSTVCPVPLLVSTVGSDEVGWRLKYPTNSEPENGRAGYRLSNELNVRTTGDTSEGGEGRVGGDEGRLLSSGDLSALGISEYHAPLHPCYATLEARLRSYLHWPPALAQTPRQLSEAGFFYVGVSDHVKCFHCDGGLRNWVPGDEPWIEHSRWYPTCGFLRLVKGPDYINGVLRDYPTQNVSVSTAPVSDSSTSTSGSTRFTEQQVDEMMRHAICETAIQLGLPRDTVKRALRVQLENTGAPFNDVSGVLSVAAGMQADMTETVSGTVVHEEGAPDEVSRPVSISGSFVGSADVANNNDSSNVVQGSPPLASPDSDIASSSGVESGHEDTGRLPMSFSPPHSDDVCLNSGSSSPSSTPMSTLTLESPRAVSADEGVSASGLEEEYRRLREQKQCKVCMDCEVGVVFLPCGHLITCVNCAPALSDCPLCRQPIRGTVRTYLS